MDPFGVSETEARKWQLPTDFWDVMMDPLFMEWKAERLLNNGLLVSAPVVLKTAV